MEPSRNQAIPSTPVATCGTVLSLQIKCGRRRDWIRVRSAVGSSSALSSALQGEFKDVIHTGVHSTNVDVHSIPDLQRNEFLPFL